MVVPSLAKVYTVGDTPGWTTGVDYSTWTKDKTFKVGDSLGEFFNLYILPNVGSIILTDIVKF
ncbi:hypothetical protein Goarm_009310 [Gossypium armourianum]|uniref:Phytocyanin domain-containing protein n=1 Tax=Gossypium armourianum TaxID=34283 RepID=A0A7J9JSF4_9ROSI|nr:hypothetical protein [Gossypium armourianum]